LKLLSSRNGRELYYLSPDNHLMVVPVSLRGNGESIAFGTPRPLFAKPLPTGATYAPAPDGDRFLISAAPTGDGAPIIILSNVAAKR
jgi:hypothetical protein